MAEDGAPPVTNVISGEAQPASQSEVLYVQGMSNPMNVGQYPQTQATVALVLSIVGLAVCCIFAPFGLFMSTTALETTKQYPGHPDHGLAQAGRIIGWIAVGIWALVAIFYLLMFGVIVATGVE